MPEVPATKQDQSEDVFFDSLKLKNDGTEASIKQQEDTFFNSIKNSDKLLPEEIEITSDNQQRESLLQAGFSNAEVNEHLGIKDVGPESKTEGIVRALGSSADYISKTLPQATGAIITGSAAWFLSKGAGSIVGLREGIDNGGDFAKGMKEGERIEKLISENLTLAPTDPDAQNIVNTLSHVIEWFTGPAREVGEIAEDITTENPVLKAVNADQLAPWIKYMSEFGTELIMFKMAHVEAKKVGKKIDKAINFLEGKLKPQEKIDIAPEKVGDFVIDNILKERSPEQALTDYENIYPKLAEKPAKESAEVIKKEQDIQRTIEAVEKITRETGKSIEEVVEIFETPAGKAQEIKALTKNIKEMDAEIPSLIKEIETKSERIKQEGIEAIEKERLRQDIEFGQRQADFLGEEISRVEKEIELAKIPPTISRKRAERFISNETYIEAKNRFAQKTKQIRTGLDPEMAKDLVTIGAYHIETGFRNFKEWSDLMVKQSGEQIRPHLNDLWEKSNTLFKEGLLNKAGEEIISDTKKQRKFIQTVKESPTTEEGLRGGVANVKPQEYVVQPNKASLSKAQKRINKSPEEAETYVKSDAPLSAEKGATFVSLIEKNQAEGNFSKAVELTVSYDMQLREAGRFVQAASIWNKLTPEGFLKWAQKEINKVNEKRGFTDRFFNKKKAELTKEDKLFITEGMAKINKMKDGPEKTKATLDMIDFVASKAPPTISEMIDAYRYQNMLSGWQTQERNIGENLFNTVITRPYDLAVEGAVDYVMSTLQGKQREAYVKDVATYYKNAISSVPNAIDAFKAVIKMDVESFGKPDIGVDFQSAIGKARAKQLPKSLTVVSRFMEASDRFNSTLISSGEYSVLRSKGVSHETALAESKALGERYLYRNKFDVNKNDLSAMSKVIVDLDKLLVDSRHLPIIGKPMSWFIPFIRTPMNKGVAMIEHSPLGYARSLQSFNRETLAKAIGGSVITAIGASYALDNKTTWAAPSDPELKKLFYASGKRPFSVLMGDRWYPVWYLGPYAMAFALPAAAKYYHEDQKLALSDNSFEKMISIANGSARFIGSQSSTQSIGAFFNMLAGDVDYTTPHQLGFMTEQILPLSGLVRTTNKILDPVYRKPDGYLESIMKDLPILSKEIEAHTTPLGEEAEREVFNAFIPYETGKEDTFFNALYRDTLEAKQFEALQRKESKKLEKELKRRTK
jgi:hypothetical protein